MQKLDLLLNYDCLGSERNLRALNLASRSTGIDIIFDLSRIVNKGHAEI